MKEEKHIFEEILTNGITWMWWKGQPFPGKMPPTDSVTLPQPQCLLFNAYQGREMISDSRVNIT